MWFFPFTFDPGGFTDLRCPQMDVDLTQVEQQLAGKIIPVKTSRGLLRKLIVP